MNDRDILIQGWRAMLSLQKHADVSLGPVLSTGTHCPDCSRFAAAVIRGVPPSDAVRFRCPSAQEWQVSVNKALRLVNQGEKVPIQN